MEDIVKATDINVASNKRYVIAAPEGQPGFAHGEKSNQIKWRSTFSNHNHICTKIC